MHAMRNILITTLFEKKKQKKKQFMPKNLTTKDLTFDFFNDEDKQSVLNIYILKSKKISLNLHVVVTKIFGLKGAFGSQCTHPEAFIYIFWYTVAVSQF